MRVSILWRVRVAWHVLRSRIRFRFSTPVFEIPNVGVSVSFDEGESSESSEVVSIPNAPDNLLVRHWITSTSSERTFEYFSYEFAIDGATYLARAYVGDPLEVHFLGKTSGSQYELLTSADMHAKGVREAIDWLRDSGKRRVGWLGERRYRRLRRLPFGRLFWI